MSRRLRKELDRSNNPVDEALLEEDKLKLQREKIFAPLVWRDLETGIKIHDLKESYFDECLQMIEDYYLDEEVLSRNCSFAKDETTKKSFLKKALHTMKNLCSIIAIDQNNKNEVAGCLLFKAIQKTDFSRVFSRVFITDGEAYQTYGKLINHMSKKFDVFEHFQCTGYLRYWLVCIKPNYRHQGVGIQLMEAGVNVARTLHLPVIMGIFSCISLQNKAKDIGMEVCYEIYYTNWRDRYNELIFDEPGIGNYSCAVMAGRTDPPET